MKHSTEVSSCRNKQTNNLTNKILQRYNKENKQTKTENKLICFFSCEVPCVLEQVPAAQGKGSKKSKQNKTGACDQIMEAHEQKGDIQ